MSEILSQTLTFLMTDIEDSTSMWDAKPEEMRAAMVAHDAIIDEAVLSHNGEVVRPRGEGDSRFVVFHSARDAVFAAIAIQRALNISFVGLPVSIRVRTGIHTGTADLRDGDYYGTTVNRCARIRGLGHGGQTLLSQATAQLVQDDLAEGISLVGLGSHRLRGLTRPETIFQLWLSDMPNEFPPLSSSTDHAINLPASPTTLIGRERELSEVSELLTQDTVRLVTLIGPGGTGKTRLSLELGRSLLDHFPDGVFFVDLAPITDPSLVASTIAHAIGIREGGGRPPIDNLKDFLTDKQLLLVLDNLEQVVAAAPIIAEMLAIDPRIKIIATSRIPLQIRGEHQYPLATLPMPPAGIVLSPVELLEFEAIRLFVRQAQTVRPDFELTEANATAVIEICRRLDGLPLALEIAAARVRMLPPEALLKRLDSSLNLLVGGAADLPSRQQTMRAAIDWSHNLLEPEQQTLFARLGVFVGGFTVESAEGVVGANGPGKLDALGGIETLLNNSLVRQVSGHGVEPRFDMLQTIRDYALEKLAESGELMTTRQAHMQYFANETLDVPQRVFSLAAVLWLPIYEAEQDNIRAALELALSVPEFAPLSAGMCSNLVACWYRNGNFHEGREWSERSMKACEGLGGQVEASSLESAAIMAVWEGDLDVAARRAARSIELAAATNNDFLKAMVNMTYGICVINQGHDLDAYHHFQEATELFHGSGDQWGQAATLVHLANAALGLGQYNQARQWLGMALTIARRVGDPWVIAFCLNNFGEVARTLQEYDVAKSYYEQTEAAFWQADAPGDYARLIHTAGYMALHDGDVTQAEALFQESLAAFRKLGNKRGMAECLAGLAAVSNDPVRGVHLLSAASAQMAGSGAAWWPADRVEIERTRNKLHEKLDLQDFERLWEEGQATSLEEAIGLATTSELSRQ